MYLPCWQPYDAGAAKKLSVKGNLIQLLQHWHLLVIVSSGNEHWDTPSFCSVIAGVISYICIRHLQLRFLYPRKFLTADSSWTPISKEEAFSSTLISQVHYQRGRCLKDNLSYTLDAKIPDTQVSDGTYQLPVITSRKPLLFQKNTIYFGHSGE